MNMQSKSRPDAPTVVLLFEDAELGAHLRDALRDLGAEIVHEGPVATASADALGSASAVVVNLDGIDDDQLDSLYDHVDESRQCIIFNDAEVSGALSGWDRARWARHLASKVIGGVDVDPPRPADARAVEIQAMPPAASAVGGDDESRAGAGDVPAAAAGSESESTDAAAEAEAEADSDSLAAELEALLAGGEDLGDLESDDAETPRALPDVDLDDGLELGDFPDLSGQEEPEAPPGAATTGDTADADDAVVVSDAQTEELELSDAFLDLDAEDAPTASGVADPDWSIAAPEPSSPPPADADDSVSVEASDPTAEPESVTFDTSTLSLDENLEGFAPVAAPAADAGAASPAAPDWGLVDFDAEAPAEPQPDRADPGQFGIEKLSAADYLAPDGGEDEVGVEPSMTLELVSIEEAIAPRSVDEAIHEMVLDDVGSAIRRTLVLAAGAGSEALDALEAFLRALARTPAAAILAVVHQDDIGAEELVQRLASASPMPVRLAADAARLRHGELVLVPAGSQVAFGRDGRLRVSESAAQPSADPSIDAALSMVAASFGDDATALVFAGDANDGLAGAQALRDRGGRVWVQDPAQCIANTMVACICEEGLAQRTGSPEELAAMLLEEHA